MAAEAPVAGAVEPDAASGRRREGNGRAQTSVTPDVRSAWRAGRTPVLLAAGLLLVCIAIAALSSGGKAGRLDPDAYDPAGSRALAVLLDTEGVAVEKVRTVAEVEAVADRSSTLLITDPGLVPAEALTRLAKLRATTVLVAPDPSALVVFTPSLALTGPAKVTRRDPGCGLPAAQAAGDADLGGRTFAAQSSDGAESGQAVLCYAADGGATLARVEATRTTGTVTVLGHEAPLTNEFLDRNGNAALALSLLGGHRELVWYLPALDDPALEGGRKPLLALLPDPLKLAAVQLFLGVVLVALWRARRLGPVVTEPLPVVVRAAEATEGRARLYRRARARDRAAEALRGAAVSRLAPRFGLGPGGDPRALADALARHTGRPPHLVADLLYGAEPADDAGLVALADALDALEQDVRRP